MKSGFYVPFDTLFLKSTVNKGQEAIHGRSPNTEVIWTFAVRKYSQILLLGKGS